MARFRKIDTRVWNDAKFMAMSDEAKLIFLFTLTHPNLTILGAMRASVPGLADELGWLPERFAKRFAEPLDQGLFRYDKTGRLLWIPNFLKYNPVENPNQLTAAISALDYLPECETKNHVLQSLEEAAKRFGKPLPKPLPQPFREPLPKPGAGAGEVTGEERREANASLSGLPKSANADDDEQAQLEKIPYQRICNLVNAILKTNYRVTEAFRKLVKARWRDGFSEEDFAKVCRVQLAAWGNDPKMSKFLRPETLFGTKMNSYLGATPGAVVVQEETDRTEFLRRREATLKLAGGAA